MPQRAADAMPRGVHILTALHGVGALACLIMAAGSAASEKFRLSLVASPGSALMMDLFGRDVWMFLLAIATLLATLSYGSWHLRRWAWALTIICYSIGVAGAAWEISIGIQQGWLAAVINAGVVTYACTRRVRDAYHVHRDTHSMSA